MPGSILGNAVRRVEDPELVRGHGTFVDNHRLEGALHGVFVRSPFAHALVTSVDTAEALAAPGVVAVVTAADLDSTPVPAFVQVNPQVSRPALAGDRVRYAGEQVALVVAETRAQAVDAAELVDVDYEELPVVVDVEDALAPGAELQYPELGSNIAASRRIDGEGDPFEGAARVVRLRMENQRLATAPIEGHAILVDPTAGPGEHGLTAWVSTQHPHLTRDLIARWTGLEKDDVRVVAPHVGGAFGGKAGMVVEHAAVVAAARLLGRPVRWSETRSEAMLSMHGRGQVQYAEAAVTDEGRVTALRLRVVGDCGAHAGFGGALAVGPTYTMSQGPYAVPRLDYSAAAVLTNTSPVGAFRGAGRPEATALLERLMDHVAREVGVPPEEVRRRNLLRPEDFPFSTLTGVTYDVGDYDLPLREALRIADVDGVRAEQARRREAGEARQLGVGIAVYVEITGAGGGEYGSVQIAADGSATVMAGTSAHGQGHATSFSMIVADRLGLSMDQVSYQQSDTAVVRTGGGTGGSRSLQLGGSAVSQAAEKVSERALEIAAEMLEVDPADLTLADGQVTVRGVPTTGVAWADLAAYAHEKHGGLGADTDFKQSGATFPFGAHVSIVEVDTETGRTVPVRHVAVDDCGRVLNPLLVEGQQHGGAVQGISQALWEQFVYDENGTPITSSFADYALPTAADTISVEASTTETPTPLNPLGAKGIGESATVGSTPAVQNAVIDAVSHLGVRHVDLPCTPQRVWTAIREAEARGPGEEQVLWREPPAAFDDLPRAKGQESDQGAI